MYSYGNDRYGAKSTPDEPSMLFNVPYQIAFAFLDRNVKKITICGTHPGSVSVGSEVRTMIALQPKPRSHRTTPSPTTLGHHRKATTKQKRSRKQMIIKEKEQRRKEREQGKSAPQLPPAVPNTCRSHRILSFSAMGRGIFRVNCRASTVDHQCRTIPAESCAARCHSVCPRR